MRRLLLLSLVAAALSACRPTPCEPGQTRSCYDGPAGTEDVGVCHGGTQTCGESGQWLDCLGEQRPIAEMCDGLDGNCDGTVDEGVKNVCGGCASLDGKPGDNCPGCGRLACKNAEALKCVAPAETIGGDCQTEEGCLGRYLCGDDGKVSCVGPKKNACGTCGGPELGDLGGACRNEAQCDGLNVCSSDGKASVCAAPDRNNCGACGLEDVAGLQTPCIGPTYGCEGVLACNASGNGTVCMEPVRNACDKCGGPELPNVGATCGAGECAGIESCNDTADGTYCSFPHRGEACVNADGCSGTIECGGDGLTRICSAPSRNACGVCSAAALSGNPGDGCTVGNCSGVLACGSSGTQLICQPEASCVPATNHVVISELAPSGPGGNGDEFVELYNPTLTTVSLSGWSLWYRSNNATGTTTKIVTLGSSASIAPSGYFLVASTGYSGSVVPDARFTATSLDMSQSATGGASVLLTSGSTTPRSATEASVVDALGYGRCLTTFAEGGVCGPSHPGSPGSIERKARASSTAATMAVGGSDALAGNGEDGQHNGADPAGSFTGDFVTRAMREPQSSQSPNEP